MSLPAPAPARPLAGWGVPRPILTRAAVLAVVALAPALGGAVVLGPWVAVGVFMGLAIGISVGPLTTLPTGSLLVAVNCAALIVGALVEGSPLGGAAVVALASLAVGPATRMGLGRGLMLSPVLAAVAASGAFGETPLPAVIGGVIGAAWGAGIMRVLGIRREPVPVDAADAWVNAGALAVTCGITTLVALATPLPHGYWIVVTLASVLQPVREATTRATGERVVGTLVGSLLAVAAGAILPTWSVALVVVGAMALFIAYALAGDGVRRVAVQTVMLVLVLAGATGTVGIEVAVERLAWTIVGAALVALSGLAADRLARTVEGPSGTPVEAP